jgi:hypothetical protein
MTIILTPFARKSRIWLFIGGALLGGIFEYICSRIQELALGTMSRDYSQEPMSF